MATPTVTPLPTFVLAPANYPALMMPNPEIAAAEKALLKAAVEEYAAGKEMDKIRPDDFNGFCRTFDAHGRTLRALSAAVAAYAKTQGVE